MSVHQVEIVAPAVILQNAPRQLNPRQKLFIRHYVETFNGVESARLAGYEGDYNVLGVCAARLLKDARVRSQLSTLLNPIADAEEILARLSKHSRASIADVLTDSGEFDLAHAKENHSDDLIKKLKIKRRVETDKDGNVTEYIDHELELHDAQAATVHLGKFHKLFTDRVETETQTSIDPDSLAVLRQLAQSFGKEIPDEQLQQALEQSFKRAELNP